MRRFEMLLCVAMGFGCGDRDNAGDTGNGVEADTDTDTDTYTGWTTTRGESAYRDPAASDPSSSCTAESAVFIR
jgi:hypothetical protein